jgi:nucleoid DNA-binding protein
MKSKVTKKILQEIAFETGVSIHEVELIVKSQFKIIPKIMATTKESVRLPLFGVFGVKPGREEKLTKSTEPYRNKDGVVVSKHMEKRKKRYNGTI